MRWPLASLVALALLGALVARSPEAAARSEKTLAYPREQAWPAAVRFLAVDERLTLVGKDADAGYVLFELRDEGKLFRGALEVIPLVVDGRPVVRFVLTIEDRPSWLEIAMLRRLEQKLRAELGSPAPAPSPKRPPKDGGKEGGKDAPRDGAKDAPPAEGDGGPPISPTP
jgi:hypothetical protein